MLVAVVRVAKIRQARVSEGKAASKLTKAVLLIIVSASVSRIGDQLIISQGGSSSS